MSTTGKSEETMLAPAGEWTIDPAGTAAGFRIRKFFWHPNGRFQDAAVNLDGARDESRLGNGTFRRRERDLRPGRLSPRLGARRAPQALLGPRGRGRSSELLDAVERRYAATVPEAATWFWREQAPVSRLPAGRALVIEAREPFTLHAGTDGWQAVADDASQPLGLGMHGVRIEAARLAGHARLEFSRRFDAGWEGRDWRLELAGESRPGDAGSNER